MEELSNVVFFFYFRLFYGHKIEKTFRKAEPENVFYIGINFDTTIVDHYSPRRTMQWRLAPKEEQTSPLLYKYS